MGCGAGAFAARLAQRTEHVDALDRSAEMIEEAKRRTPDNVNCMLADVLADPLPGKDYDAIFSISALHHMPLQDALPVLAAALRPGGVLAAIALPRPDLRRELPVEIAAAIGAPTQPAAEGHSFLRRLVGDPQFEAPAMAYTRELLSSARRVEIAEVCRG